MKRVKLFCAILALSVVLAGGMSGCDTMGHTEESRASEESQMLQESRSSSDEKEAADSTEANVRENTEEATKENTEESTEGKFADRADADTDAGEIKTLTEGDVAPNFTAQLVDGGTFKMSDHDDEVVILNFFATWCGPCVREMPAFDMLKADGYEHLAILCVDCMEKAKTVDSFVQEKGFTFSVAYDEDGRIEKYYPTDGIPYTLVINQGVISKIYLGAMDAQTQYEEYKGAIDACLGQ